jgi:predicted protein tyrosine phosphatase
MDGRMTSVRCCGLNTLPHQLEQFKPDLVISCVPPNVDLGDTPMLKTGMEDIYNQTLIPYKNAVRRVLEAEGTRILVHCQHGLSRSAALACAKIYQSDPDGVDKFLEANPEVQPNPLLVLIADEELGADFDLLRRCRKRLKGASL